MSNTEGAPTMDQKLQLSVFRDMNKEWFTRNSAFSPNRESYIDSCHLFTKLNERNPVGPRDMSFIGLDY